ncbi:RNA-guided endonuclease InsQ/TnpB family protein [Conexivisphaera calida]|uniref:RNA-guided endonuclease InsQ/TnpB family protein n=1 Tax=Conexivisphaera calida TaxID=1874277 RepID=UPI001E392B14|nr:transposase [Conexivisphaera calida]
MSDGAGATPQPSPALVEEPGPSSEITVFPAPEDNGTRAIVVRLLPNGAQERKLRRLADAAAKLWNELNYERRQQYFGARKQGLSERASLAHVDLKGTRKRMVPNYTEILGASAWAVERKNAEAWSSFRGLLKAKSKGKLPPWIHPAPPGYNKDRKTGRRKPWLPVHHEMYTVDPEAKVIHIPRYNLRLRFAGDVRWHGKQERMEIWYDEARRAWYASIAVKVGAETTRNGTKPRHIVQGGRRSIEVARPVGDKVAGIDLGVNIIASVVVGDGAWIIYKGARLKEDYFHFEGRIARLESEAARAKSVGDEKRHDRLRAEVRRLKRKWAARRIHLYRNLASHLIRGLWGRGVSTVYVGYPYEIARDNGNKYSVNIWAYRELIGAIEAEAREYGISVYEVYERGTSSHCAYHGVEVKRSPRGVVTCPVGDHRLHSDLNGALNILRRGSGVLVRGNLRPLSFIVDHNGVAPANSIAPTKGGNAQNPGVNLGPQGPG